MRRAVKISLLRSTFPFVTFLLSSDQFKSLAAAGPSTTRDAHTNQGRAFFLELPHRHLPCSDRQLVLTEPDVRDFPPINKRSYYVTWCGCFATPDIDSITVPTTTTQYLADAAQFSGKDISIVASPEGTDGKKLAVSTGGNYTVTFDVSVVNAGTHSVLILYLSGSPASAKVKASSSKEMTVNFPSTSGNPSDSTVVGAASVNLDFVAGSNTVTISSNSKETPPDLDSIIVVQ